MSRIFVNYRRADSNFAAAKVAEYLRSEFGEQEVFFDVKNIQSGEEWAKEIRRALRKCEIFVIVIGVHWLSELKNRLGTPDSDWARLEIRFALENNLKILPLLIDTQMPSPTDLPDDVRRLTEYQDVNVRYRYFDTDIIALKQAIIRIITTVPNYRYVPPPPSIIPESSPNPPKPQFTSSAYSPPSPTYSPPSPAYSPPPVIDPKPLPKPQVPQSNLSRFFFGVVDLLSESTSWKSWGLTALVGVLAFVIPVTALSSLSSVMGWGGYS